MEPFVLDDMHAHADHHWWFRGRWRVVSHLLDQHSLPRGVGSEPRVLDLGCGTGTHLHDLRRYGRVHGADSSDRALAYCRERFAGPLTLVQIPERIPFADASFELVVMLDVLEHIADDGAALDCVHRILVANGLFCLTVPALPWLWSRHDEDHHHFRRYQRDPLAQLLRDRGFEVVVLSYMNSLLFPAMAAVRLGGRLVDRVEPPTARDRQPGPAARVAQSILHPLLYRTFAAERHFIGRFRPRIGGSLLALARRL